MRSGRFNRQVIFEGPVLCWRPWIRVNTPFDEDFVETLKARFPLRVWDPTTKSWWLPRHYAKEVERLVQSFFGKGNELPPEPTMEEAPAADPREAHGPYYQLGVYPEAPDPVVKAVYKALAFELHPDRGGDLAAFLALQEAWGQIQKERGL